jgi:DNA-binding transcriptional MerR regulator
MAIDALEATIPIREISRLTGVNSVTLRAWERRYGLIKPLRTNKGHRLYRNEDIELIKKIQAWLARGLAIGKISELLDPNQFSYELSVENIWQTYLEELISLLAELHVGKLDAWFNQLFAVYPAELIADQLVIPVLDILDQEIYGNAVKKAILINRVSEYLQMLTQRQRQSARRERVAIVHLTTDANPLLNVILHYGLTVNQFRSELIGLTTTSDAFFAVNQLQLDALVVYNNSCSSLGDFKREIFLLSQKVTLPIIVAGSIAVALDFDYPPHVNIARNTGLQGVLETVNQIFPVDKNIAGVKL